MSVNANTTGGILDTRMRYLPSTDFDDVRVKITAGGTFAAGTASTVTYSVFVKNDDGLAMQRLYSLKKLTVTTKLWLME